MSMFIVYFFAAIIGALYTMKSNYKILPTKFGKTERNKENSTLLTHFSSDSKPLVCPASPYNKGNSCNIVKVPNDPIQCQNVSQNINMPFILDCYCATYKEEDNLIEIGRCFYNCGRHGPQTDTVYQPLPQNLSEWNYYMCGEYNRSNTLCGTCNAQEHLYPQVYSFDSQCIKCEEGVSQWWKYIVLAYLPLTIFYVLILLLKLDIHSSPMRGFVIFSQFISTPAVVRVLLSVCRKHPTFLYSIKLVEALLGIWNLDFFRVFGNSICVGGLDSLADLFLDLTVAVYPLLLIAITYVVILSYDYFKFLKDIWKPMSCLLNKVYRKLSINTSVLDAVTTFLFLSNMKILGVCFDTLTPVKVYRFDSSGCVSISWRLFYDPTIHYFGSKHQLYAVTAIIILLFVYICPLLILSLNPCSCFQNFISQLPHRLQIFYHTFMDAFYGSYKDGSDKGTRDCRLYALVLPITRVALMMTYGYTFSLSFLPLSTIILTIVVILTVLIDPYKEHLKHLSSILSISLLLIAFNYICAATISIIASKGSDAMTKESYILMAVMCSVILLFVLITIFISTYSRKCKTKC